jgi:hypothetical protein
LFNPLFVFGGLRRLARGLEFKDKGRLAERTSGAACHQHRRKRHLPARNRLADH